MVYKTTGTCSRAIEFDVVDGKLQNVKFVGGCDGNLQGIAALVDGMAVEDVMKRVKGIPCGMKKTSCPDQLARAIESFMQSAHAPDKAV